MLKILNLFLDGNDAITKGIFPEKWKWEDIRKVAIKCLKEETEKKQEFPILFMS